MKNMKFWRTALVATLVLTVMLSVTGGTIAWFTDSVTTKTNTIQAGNLDIELEYMKPEMTDWEPVTEDTALFDNSTLWEPGHTEVVALRIKNVGSLALKFDLQVKVNEEKASTNVYGDAFMLSDYLEVWHSAVNGDNEGMGTILAQLALMNRNAVIGDGVTAWKTDFDTSIVNQGEDSSNVNYMGAGDAAVTVIAITMPTTVGNEANHMTGVDAPTISFGIELEATQAMSESDSFGSDYDEGALFPGQVDNADDLRDAMGNGEDVELTGDIEAPAELAGPYNGVKVGFIQNGGVFDGKGYTMEIDGGNKSYGIMTSGGTIKNVTIKGVERGIMLNATTEDVILDNVTLDDAGYAINTAEYATVDGVDLIATNSTIKGWTSFSGIESASFTNCTFGENTNKYWQNMGYDQDFDRLVRPYVSTEFKNCVFEQGFYIDLSALGRDKMSGIWTIVYPDAKITLDNCTVNGVKITADNYDQYITIELPTEETGGAWTLEQCVIFK